MENYKDHLEKIINCLGDSIFVHDRQHRYVFINDKCARNKGQKKEDIIGKTGRDFFPKEQADVFWEADEIVFKTGQEHQNEEELTGPDGKLTTILTTKNLYTDHDGNKFIVGVSQDITKLKEAEEALQKYNEKLEDTVAIRTAELNEANSRLENRIKQLDFLNQKARILTSSIDKKTLLPAIYYTFAVIIRNSQIHLIEYTGGGFDSVYYTEIFNDAVVRTETKKMLNQERFENERIYFLEDWKKNPEFEKTFPSELASLPCYMEIPLITDAKLRGIVQVFAPQNFCQRFADEETVIHTLATQAAISLDNANLYSELAEKARLQSELEIARKIQMAHIPKEPNIPGFKLKGFCLPANEVGGDFIDYFQNKNGDWIILIADVCGKGVPAALMTTSLRSSLRLVARNRSSAKEILQVLNSFLRPDLMRENSFITSICLVINKKDGLVKYCRAGHPMVIKLSPHAKPEVIESEGIGLGMVDEDTFDKISVEKEIVLEKEDKIFLYTDGLDEAQNPEKEAYGLKRLHQVLDTHKTKSPNDLAKAILEEWSSYLDGQRQYDDLTMLIIEKVGMGVD
ncbi:MAG: SpoIIE family protein phosphatase [Fibrobacteria bacterium]|nr:SpoIIE family protein phosphatase [Fibrobacteria bacterium]